MKTPAMAAKANSSYIVARPEVPHLSNPRQVPTRYPLTRVGSGPAYNPEPRMATVINAATRFNTPSCPNCSGDLVGRHCKLWCSRGCGYYEGCSDLV